jgi:hypothetical protein
MAVYRPAFPAWQNPSSTFYIPRRVSELHPTNRWGAGAMGSASDDDDDDDASMSGWDQSAESISLGLRDDDQLRVFKNVLRHLCSRSSNPGDPAIKAANFKMAKMVATGGTSGSFPRTGQPLNRPHGHGIGDYIKRFFNRMEHQFMFSFMDVAFGGVVLAMSMLVLRAVDNVIEKFIGSFWVDKPVIKAVLITMAVSAALSIGAVATGRFKTFSFFQSGGTAKDNNGGANYSTLATSMAMDEAMTPPLG